MKKLFISLFAFMFIAGCSPKTEGVDVVFPYFYFADLPIADIQEDFDHEPFEKIARNEQRQVVFTMPEERREQLEQQTYDNMIAFLDQDVSMSFQKIEHNEDYTEFTLHVEEQKYMNYQEENLLFVLLEDSVLHQVYSNKKPETIRTVATIVNEHGEEIQKITLADDNA